ncbi:MAG: DUF2933 domain-containing protein [Blastococcus sp.]|nr:DUF2933 domain-containing protein [Blastococcus sp.]
MNHGKHLYLMIGMVALVSVLWFTSAADTGWVLFLWLGVCAAMMFFMMRGMGGGGQYGGGGSDESERIGGHRH